MPAVNERSYNSQADYVAGREMTLDGKHYSAGDKVPNKRLQKLSTTIVDKLCRTRFLVTASVYQRQHKNAIAVEEPPELVEEATEEEQEASAEPVDLDDMGPKALRRLCKKHGLSSFGAKSVLVRRLRAVLG